MTTCNNHLCPRKEDCARHESHYSYETTPKHHHFYNHSGRFACEDFLYKPTDSVSGINTQDLKVDEPLFLDENGNIATSIKQN